VTGRRSSRTSSPIRALTHPVETVTPKRHFLNHAKKPAPIVPKRVPIVPKRVRIVPKRVRVVPEVRLHFDGTGTARAGLADAQQICASETVSLKTGTEIT
jgi:hypothetical protein